MSFFKQLYDNFEEGACALFVAVMVLCLFLQVAMRIAVGSSLAWTEELSRYSFLWAVYVGAALAVKRGGHVRITAQFMFLPTAGGLCSAPSGTSSGSASPFMWRGSGSLHRRGPVLPRSVAYPRRCEGVGGMHYPVQLRAGELAHR